VSAFMVSPTCIARVVFALRAAHVEYLQADADLVGMTLVEMNRRALVARYGDNAVDAVEPFRYVEPTDVQPRLLVQVYKSLRCYLYQCSEGDIPDQPLYLQLATMKRQMANVLGHKNETWQRADIKAVYDECDWG